MLLYYFMVYIKYDFDCVSLFFETLTVSPVLQIEQHSCDLPTEFHLETIFFYCLYQISSVQLELQRCSLSCCRQTPTLEFFTFPCSPSLAFSCLEVGKPSFLPVSLYLNVSGKSSLTTHIIQIMPSLQLGFCPQSMNTIRHTWYLFVYLHAFCFYSHSKKNMTYASNDSFSMATFQVVNTVFGTQ